LNRSAILTFRDEYPDLVADESVEKAKELASHCVFIGRIYCAGNGGETYFAECFYGGEEIIEVTWALPTKSHELTRGRQKGLVFAA
jgi:hypothetical protein